MQRRIRVSVLGTRGFPGVQGGVEEHCKNLYSRLSDSGCDVVVFTRMPYTGEGNKRYNGVKLVPVSCPRKKSFEAIVHTLKCVFLAKKYDPDIVHFHAIGPSILVPLARLFGMKVVMTNHGPDYNREKWGFLAKTVLRIGECLGSVFSNEVICISKPIADNIERSFRIRTNIIPNGVDIPVKAQTENVLGKFSLQKKKYILTVGRFVPEKGFKDLIDAFLALNITDRKLVIVGNADHESGYSRDIRSMAEKERNIVLTGFLTGDDLKEIYSHAGLFVLPSYHEGLPIVLLEAMSYGLRCIPSRIPANICVGLPDENYFNAGDVRELKVKLTEFMNSSLTPEEQSEQISFIKKTYDWGKIAEKTLEVYESVIKRG